MKNLLKHLAYGVSFLLVWGLVSYGMWATYNYVAVTILGGTPALFMTAVVIVGLQFCAFLYAVLPG